MRIGFFTVVRRDPQHFVHAGGLVAAVRRVMPSVAIIQFTDETTPAVTGVDDVRRRPHGRMLERRLEHYAATDGSDWLLIDTDVQILRDVSGVFVDMSQASLAVADRQWPGIPQGDDVMLTMPYNTGVCFSRSPVFWAAVLDTWRRFPEETQKSWLSEQLAFYQVVRTGAFRIQILPGQVYNYPPRSVDDPCTNVALAHYKGPRKAWLSALIAKQAQGVAPTIAPVVESPQQHPSALAEVR